MNDGLDRLAAHALERCKCVVDGIALHVERDA
jgi:hypothetical protein